MTFIYIYILSISLSKYDLSNVIVNCLGPQAHHQCQTPCFPSILCALYKSHAQLTTTTTSPKSPSHLFPFFFCFCFFLKAHNSIWPEMKREGRQHGMVRTYRILPTPLNPRPDTRFVNRFDSPATAGLFTRVPSKPTNHSKFTGKCGQPRCNGCHMHPTCKAKDKTKGNQKLRSNDVLSNHRLLTWRVVDARPGLNFSGVSATGIVDQLSSYHVDDHDHDDGEEEVGDYVYDHEDRTVEINNAVDDDDQVGHGGDDEEEMSFCDVGFVLEQVEGDDGWCLVGEK